MRILAVKARSAYEVPTPPCSESTPRSQAVRYSKSFWKEASQPLNADPPNKLLAEELLRRLGCSMLLWRQGPCEFSHVHGAVKNFRSWRHSACRETQETEIEKPANNAWDWRSSFDSGAFGRGDKQAVKGYGKQGKRATVLQRARSCAAFLVKSSTGTWPKLVTSALPALGTF